MASEFEKKKERHASGESAISTVSDYIPTPPDGGYGWVIVFASFVNHIIVDGIAFTFGVFYLEFLDFFGESKGKTALVGSLLCGFYLMTGPIAGALTNKFGCRPVCVAGGLIASASMVLATFSPSLNYLIVTYGILGGFGFGLIYLPSVISVSYYFEQKRAMATGIAVCGAGVGCFMFAPVGRLLLDYYDWKNALLIVAGVVLNSCVCGMLMRPLEAPRRKRRPRRKNVLDRLREQTLLKHSNSDAIAVNKDEEIIERVQEVKLARERMLREEEGSEYSFSVTNSAVNSVRRLDRQESIGSRHMPNSESMSPTTVPEILIEAETEENHVTEMTSILKKDPLITKNGASHRENGHVPQVMYNIGNHPSLPNGVHQTGIQKAPVANGNLSPTGNGAVVNNGGMQSLKITSAQDIWALQARKRQIRKAEGICKSDYARPLYRKDIFYSGSILHIPQFNSQPNVKSYLRSTTSIPYATSPMSQTSLSPARLCCGCFPKSAADTLHTMLDVSIFKDPIFVIACIANAFGMLGLYVPFVFIAERAIVLGVQPSDAAFLLSVIGITNTAGRIIAGCLADFKWMNSLLMHNIALILAGVSCVLVMFATTYVTMCLFCAFFGLCVATWISLTSIILCNLIGLERLTNAFGLLTMVRGVCSVAGPPLAGMIFDATQNFNASFIVGGVLMLLAGLLCLLLHLPFLRVPEDIAMEMNVPSLPDDLDCDFQEEDEAVEGEGEEKEESDLLQAV